MERYTELKPQRVLPAVSNSSVFTFKQWQVALEFNAERWICWLAFHIRKVICILGRSSVYQGETGKIQEWSRGSSNTRQEVMVA